MVAAGIVSLRSRSTSVDVAASCGEVVGVTVRMAASPALLRLAGATAATPGASFSWAPSASSFALSSEPPPWLSMASSSGPLKPGPNAADSWS